MLVVLLLAAIAAQPSVVDRAVVIGDVVIVRETPHADGKESGRLRYGTSVIVEERRDGFAKVRSSGGVKFDDMKQVALANDHSGWVRDTMLDSRALDADELKGAVDAALTRGHLEEAKTSAERHAALTGRAKTSLELLAVVAKARGDNDAVTKLHDEIERGAIWIAQCTGHGVVLVGALAHDGTFKSTIAEPVRRKGQAQGPPSKTELARLRRIAVDVAPRAWFALEPRAPQWSFDRSVDASRALDGTPFAQPHVTGRYSDVATTLDDMSSGAMVLLGACSETAALFTTAPLDGYTQRRRNAPMQITEAHVASTLKALVPNPKEPGAEPKPVASIEVFGIPTYADRAEMAPFFEATTTALYQEHHSDAWKTQWHLLNSKGKRVADALVDGAVEATPWIKLSSTVPRLRLIPYGTGEGANGGSDQLLIVTIDPNGVARAQTIVVALWGGC